MWRIMFFYFFTGLEHVISKKDYAKIVPDTPKELEILRMATLCWAIRQYFPILILPETTGKAFLPNLLHNTTQCRKTSDAKNNIAK